MPQRPTLTSDRLILRPFAASDAPVVQTLAADRAIADTTLSIPHPYPAGAAATWIAQHGPAFARGELVNFAIVRRDDEALIGAIGLHLSAAHGRAELGYWLGTPYWNAGYTTEAAAAVLRYGLTVLPLNRIYAFHFVRNPASGRVMQKIGMQHEGTLRRHVRKWDDYEDVAMYGILRSELAVMPPPA